MACDTFSTKQIHRNVFAVHTRMSHPTYNEKRFRECIALQHMKMNVDGVVHEREETYWIFITDITTSLTSRHQKRPTRGGIIMRIMCCTYGGHYLCISMDQAVNGIRLMVRIASNVCCNA
eukprot:443960_1